MEEWAVKKCVGNWNQDVENGEKDDGMCEKFCDAGLTGGNIDVG